MKSLGIAEETVHTQFMILRELIKTGLTCGNDSLSKTEISVLVHIDENIISVEVDNTIDETGFKRLDELDRMIQFINGYQDPLEAYLIKRKEIALNSLHRDLGSLDLLRTVYEGKTKLDFFVNEDQEVKISATRKLEGSFCNVN